jgi:hypothetical protein
MASGKNLLANLFAVAVFTNPFLNPVSRAEDSRSAALLSQISPFAATSSDRVIGGHERRLEQLRKEQDVIQRELDLAESRGASLQEELVRLKGKKEELKDKNQMIQEWKDATFLVASDRMAYAIHAGSGDQFRLLAKEDLKRSEYVQRVAHRFSIPLVRPNDSAIDANCLNVGKGAIFPAAATKILQEYWKIRRYLPIGASDEKSMLVFRDLETMQHRVGYLLGIQNDRFEFVSLTGKTELISRDRVESGSSRVGTYQELLVEPEVNMLDVAALEIAKHLSSSRAVPSYQLVTVSVDVDELKESVLLSRQIDDSYNDHVLDLISRLNGEAYVPDQRKEGARILRRYRDVLHDQLSHRLVEIGVPVGNREDLEVLRTERNLGQSTDFDQRRYSLMTSASHTVTAKVGKPEAGGRFRVSIRLNDVNNGLTLLEFHAEEGRTAEGFPTEYFVNSGSPVLLTDRNATEKNNRGVPHRLVMPSLETPSFDSRLGVFAKIDGSNYFYDLFSTKGFKIEGERFTGNRDTTPGSLPDHQKFRWLTWEIAKAALPSAGRVRSIDDDRLEINLGSNHGLQPGSVLRVIRPQEADYQRTNPILPFELKADTVQPNSAIAVMQKDGFSQLWPEMSIQLDDIVLPRGLMQPVIKIESPQASYMLLPDKAQRVLETVFKNDFQRGRLSRSMAICGDQLVKKMMFGLHSHGYSAFSADPANPTHIVSSIISPLEADPDCKRFAVQFTVRSLNGDRSTTIPAVQMSSNEVGAWKP